jgi:hypothetical protein
MRFVLAAFAALLVLMLDLDGSGLVSPANNSVFANDLSFQTLWSAAAVFESARAAEEPSATPDREAANPISPPAETEVKSTTPSAADAFCHALREAAEASEIPVAFFARLIWQESRFRSSEVSHAGAQGVAQFMPGTAAEVGLDDPFDPFKALPASAKLLRKLRDDFGNLGLAAAACNAGSGRIQKWLAKQGQLPRETRDYVRIITGTNAEDWIDDADLLAIRVDLPQEAPCEGVGGLSKARDIVFVSSAPAPSVTTIIRKAEAAQMAARPTVDRGRKRLALLLRKNAPSAGAVRLGKRHTIAARTAGKSTKGRIVRIASRERSSS